MNRQAYKHLLETFAKRPLWWLGWAGEIIRTFTLRIVNALIIAHMTGSIAGGDLDAAKRDIIAFFATNVGCIIIGSLGDMAALQVEDTTYANMEKTYAAKLATKDMAFYRDNQTGYLVSLFRQYLDSGILLLRLIRGEISRITISLVAPVVVLLIADWRIGLIALAVVVLQVVYIAWSSKITNKYRVLSHEIYRKVTGEVSDQITNIVAFKSSGQEVKGRRYIDTLVDQETETFLHRKRLSIYTDIPRSLITAIGTAGAYWIIVTSFSGPSSVAFMTLTLMYFFQLMRSVGDVPGLVLQHDELVTKLLPTLPYIDGHQTITDPPKPKRLKVTKGAIAITDVDFYYPSPDGDTPGIRVFRNLTLQIAGGEQVGVVGLSGAGKSTLASLLMRFDDVSGGSISIDGIDIRAVRQAELRQHIGYVPQEPLLFHRTIRENIAYFQEEATDKQVIAAAKAAHAHDFIQALPQGYDSMVGERGLKLSGGQKQRVVIARAILKNAPILIFDEATSALDSESEQIIHQALPRIMGKHTAVVIAHRLSTVANLDRIIVMHDGAIAEQGTHSELLALQGRYYSLWQKQTSEDT